MFAQPEDRVLIKADYSQIELRIAAKLTGDRCMLDAYRTGQDLHTLTASVVTGKPLANVAKADRQLAKAINFGLLFGMGAKSLVDYARTNYGVSMTLANASAHRNAFFRTYSGLFRWHQVDGNRRSNDTRTLGGRLRSNVEQFTERLNTPVQGTGADGLKAAIALLWERRRQCPSAVPVLYAHDEIVVECDEASVEATSTWLKQCMIDGMSPLIAPIPVEVEVTSGRTWAGN